MLLQVSGFQGQALGRSLAGLVVASQTPTPRVLPYRLERQKEKWLLQYDGFNPSVAAMLPSHTPVRERMRRWHPSVTQMVTQTVPIPTALRGDLRHRLEASVTANIWGCPQG
ncbi:UNVERIFIED_CONTAM: hypothetical protein FKN15_064862 [Acipenser sinensis]